MASASVATPPSPPAWAMVLGVVALLFGCLMTAAQSNELLLQTVIAPNTAADRNIPADCRPDEAAQEGVSIVECDLMVAGVKATIVSRPGWFRDFQRTLALVSALVAFASVLVGLGLADFRPWAPTAAVWTFFALLVLDAVGFSAALYTGPLLRAVYLWNILLWFSIHLCLAAGAMVGRRLERAAAVAPQPAMA